MTRGSVGIAIPAYRRGRFLAATLDSALAQSRPAAEIIVVDDCSPDSTGEVARAYGSRGITYVRNAENVGVPGNYNVALGQLTSDYVFILEDHDLLDPMYLERCAALLDAHPHVDVVFTAIAEIDDAGRVIRENYIRAPAIIPSDQLAKRWVASGALCGLTAVIRRAALAGLEPYFDPKYWAYADIYLWIRLALRGDAAYVPETLLKMRIRETGHHLDGREWESLLCVDRMKRDCWPLVFPGPTVESRYRRSLYRLGQDRQGLQQMIADIARNRRARWRDMPHDVRRYFTPLGRLLAWGVSRVSPAQARLIRSFYQSLVVAPLIGTRRPRGHTRLPAIRESR